jgi:hypothetical protein
MDTWRGHFPITHFVLRALTNKRNGVGAVNFSGAEAILLAACECWAAVATRQLPRYLDPNPECKLLVACEAFSEIGAVRIASALRVVARDCQAILSLPEKALELEARLLDTEDAVDHLIAQYASVHSADEPSEEDGWMSAAAPWLNPG